MRTAEEPRRRRLRRLGPFVLAVALASSAQAFVSPAHADEDRRPSQPARSPEPVGDISHMGRWLTDASGRVVLLHGVNMVEKQAPYFPAAFGFDGADASFLQESGLKVVRLGVLATGLMPTPGHIDEAYLDHLESTVRALERHHIFVLLDLHQDGFSPTVGSDGFPAWMTLTGNAVNNGVGFPLYYVSDPATQQAFQSLWDDAPGPNGVPLQTDVAIMANALARHFSRVRNVIGYDFFNEPWPGTTWQTCLSNPGCPNLERSELDPLYARVDRAVRSAGSSQLLFVEPFVLFNFGSVVTNVALPGSDAASGLSFHQYATSLAAGPNVLANALAWSELTGGALLDTEWGATTDGSAITSQAGQFDRALVPWIFWSFDGETVSNLALAPSGANLVASTVDALIRPYPLVTAGTPGSVSYETSLRSFTASWSTLEPSGTRAAPGSVTSIEVPTLDYPSGYSVRVSGADITSAPCSNLLTLATHPHASTVSVKITPGGDCEGDG